MRAAARYMRRFPAVNRSNGDDHRFERVDAPALDRLQGRDAIRRHNDRIDPLIRPEVNKTTLVYILDGIILIPQLPPAPLFRLPLAVFGLTALAVLAAAWLGAWRVQRQAERVSVAEVMRVAG